MHGMLRAPVEYMTAFSISNAQLFYLAICHGDYTCKKYSSRIAIEESNDFAINESEQEVVPNPAVYKNQRRLLK
jgi:hypothetical protein